MEISRVLYSNARTSFNVNYTPNVVFARRETGDLELQLLIPSYPAVRPPKIDEPPPHKRPPEQNKPHHDGHKPPRFPLVVDVPGSGWGGASGIAHVPKMVELAKEGFVVASISYRGTRKDDVRYPAAVQDTKEAIRFLRANADAYHIDPRHVTLLGDSSGGHTVAAAALTGDESRFNIGENLDQPTYVTACVMFYAPVDLPNLVADRLAEGKRLRPGEGEYPFEAREIFKDDYLADPEAMLADASPINYIQPDKKMPPFLLIQGDDDPIIPMAQGLRFCDRVRGSGGRAEFVKIAGGLHGDGCWSPEAMSLVVQFLKAYN